MRARSLAVLVSLLVVAPLARPAAAQAPGKFPPDSLVNTKVFPHNTPVTEVLGAMRNFTTALGVRCGFCHVGKEGAPISSYDFAMTDGRPFTQIGTGSGLLPHPVVRQDILLGPAQRTDVTVDFRGLKGENVVLLSIPRTDGSTNGTGSRTASIMQFRVRGKPAPKARVPFNLAAISHFKVPRKTAKVWRFGLSKDHHGSYWSINGKRFDPKRVDHKVVLGSTERWKLVNTSPFTHYVHLHEELWRTLERDGHAPPPWERGYEDTWRLDPGESVV